jgi:hypothetical protein
MKPAISRPWILAALGASVVFGLALSPQARAVASALVTITNTAANPVPTRNVDNRAQNAFATRLYPNASADASFTVPAGKYLVIDSVSAFVYGSTTVVDLGVYTTTNGIGAGALMPFAINNHGVNFASANFNLVADPGTTVTVLVDDTNYADSAGMNVDIRGYFVPAP